MFLLGSNWTLPHCLPPPGIDVRRIWRLGRLTGRARCCLGSTEHFRLLKVLNLHLKPTSLHDQALCHSMTGACHVSVMPLLERLLVE